MMQRKGRGLLGNHRHQKIIIKSMATKVVEHGRRKGTRKVLHGPQAGEQIKPSEVTVLSAGEWQRMKGQLNSWEEDKVSRIQARRLALHEHSKEIVKNWGNTIEGQRLKRLQAHQIREDGEEKERMEIDEEEAKFQAEQRKKSIEGAKTLLYYETDRVKQLHSALVLSEVIRERDAQIKCSKQRQELMKDKDKVFLKIQQEERESAIIADMKAAEERAKGKKATVEYQSKQAAEKTGKKLQARLADLEEQKILDKEAAKFNEEKQALLAEETVRQKRTRKELDNILKKNKNAEEEEERKLKIDLEGMEIFTKAKKKMARLRKEKESELFQQFESHQNYMCKQLQEQMQKASSDEDSRTALAAEQQQAKREAEEQTKQAEFMAATRDIHRHMIEQMRELEERKEEEEKMEKDMLVQRMIQDQKFHSQQLDKKMKAHQESLRLQEFHNSQAREMKARREAEREEDLAHNCKNLELLKVEEVQYQQYAAKTVSEAKERGGHLYPLHQATQKGAGGGHGPVMSDTGLCPSYQVLDETAIELPSYSQNKMEDKTKTKKSRTQQRLGFNW